MLLKEPAWVTTEEKTLIGSVFLGNYFPYATGRRQAVYCNKSLGYPPCSEQESPSFFVASNLRCGESNAAHCNLDGHRLCKVKWSTSRAFMIKQFGSKLQMLVLESLSLGFESMTDSDLRTT